MYKYLPQSKLSKELINELDRIAYECSDYRFVDICAFGRYDIVKYLYESKSINEQYLKDGFIVACENGQMMVAKWLQKKQNYNSDTLSHAFKSSCLCGQLDIVKWLYENYKDKIVLNNQNSNKTLMLSNNGLGRVIIDDDINIVFAYACQYNHVNIVNWMYETNIIIVDDTTETSAQNYAFYKSCVYGHLELAKWLYFKNMHRGMENKAFVYSCFNGQLVVAQWIHETFPNIVFDYYKAFNLSYNHIDVMKWLCTINDDFIIDIVDDKIVSSKKIVVNKQLKEAIKLGTLDDYYNNNALQIDNEICSLCLETDETTNKFIKLIDCSHVLCIDCYMKKNRCSFGCHCDLTKIDLLNVKNV